MYATTIHKARPSATQVRASTGNRASRSRFVCIMSAIALFTAVTMVSSGTASATDFEYPAATSEDVVAECGFTDIMFVYPHSAVTPRSSQFYFSVNGGGWMTTEWYYFSGSNAWYYSGNRWIDTTGTQQSYFLPGGAVTVEAWELRYYSNGYTQWVDLGSCSTESYESIGIQGTYVDIYH